MLGKWSHGELNGVRRWTVPAELGPEVVVVPSWLLVLDGGPVPPVTLVQDWQCFLCEALPWLLQGRCREGPLHLGEVKGPWKQLAPHGTEM